MEFTEAIIAVLNKYTILIAGRCAVNTGAGYYSP
jgi:predicted membrane protein